MALLGTFTDVTVLCLAGNASGCLAHGLPTQPDWAVYQPTGTIGALACLVTRGNSAIWWFNAGGSATPGQSISQFVHSIQR